MQSSIRQVKPQLEPVRTEIPAKQIEDFYMIFGGHIFFQTLNAGVELDLFTKLDNHPGMKMEEISTALEIQEQPTKILLLGLTSIGLIEKRQELYYNSIVSNEMLSKNSPRNVINYVRLQNQGMYKAMPHFVESLKQNSNLGLGEFFGTEKTFYERLKHKPDLSMIFQNAMMELSIQTNANLVDHIDFSSSLHLLDVGGGNGTNAMTIAKSNPQLRATVFDLPQVCQMATQHIKKHEMSDRVSAVVGNIFKDPIPAGVDAILFCHFFTIWSKQKNLLILKNCYDALPKGGKVMIFNMMQNDEGTGPLTAAMGSPYFLTLATGEGMLYSWKEYESLFLEAGFKNLKRSVLPFDHGVIQGEKI